MTIKNKLSNGSVLGAFIILIVWIISVRKTLFTEGIIVHKDVRYPLSLKQFIELTAYTWIEKHDMPNAFMSRYPLIFLIKVLSTIVSYNVAIKLYILLPPLIAGISMYFTTCKVLKELTKIAITIRESKESYVPLAALLSALMYMTNPYAILIWHNSTFMSIGYSVLPLIFYCLYMILFKHRLRYYIGYAILISLASIQPHPLLLWILPLTFLTIIIYTISKRIHLKHLAKSLIVLIIIIALVNAYWILPLGPLMYEYKERTPLYSLNPHMLAFYSKNSTMINVFNLEHHPWDDDRLPLELNSDIYMKAWFITGILLVIISTSILHKFNRLRREAKILVCTVSLLYVLSIIWALGIHSPIGSIYKYIVLHIPFGWIMRTPHKFDGLIAFTLSFLLALSFNMILNDIWNLFHKKVAKISIAILFSLVISLIFFHGWPMFTGDFNARFSPQNAEFYIDLTKFFKDESYLNNGLFNVLWLPPGFWHFRLRDVGLLSIDKNVFSTYPVSQREYIYDILETLKKGELEEVASKLSAIGVKYIVIDLNLISEEQYKYWLYIATRFGVNHGFELGKKIGWYTPFEKRGKWFIQSNIASEGKYAAKISSYSDKLYSIIQDTTFPVLHPQRYPIVVRAMFYPLSTGIKCFIVINWYDANLKHIGTTISNNYYCNNSVLEWIKAEIKVKAPPDAKYFRAGIAVSGNGTIYVDDLEVVNPRLFRVVYLDDYFIVIQNVKSAKLIYILNASDSTIFAIDKVSPTHYTVKMYSRKAFRLVFCEGYNPLWEARVYKDGRLVEVVRSVPVYGVINGFWINETGNLTIVIRYVPQDWFELGLKISAATFALCIFYLVWDWRRSRGDRWAIWLGKRVRSIPRYLRGASMRVLRLGT